MSAVAPVELPPHVEAGDAWKAWPRKVAAHLEWGVRQRQIDAFTRNGKLRVYACPDGINRLDPVQLRELFGDSGVVQGRDRDLSASERKRRLAEAEADPVALMFREVVGMLQDMHKESIGLLRVVSDPLKTVLDAASSTIAAQAERIKTLEAHADEAVVLKSELADAKQERELAVKRHDAAEQRREQTMSLLKEQVPALMRLYVEGDSLSSFAKRAPRAVIETIVESDTVSESDAEILRRAAGIPPKPAPQQSNGVVDHGHS
jgi:hypothetical protein